MKDRTASQLTFAAMKSFRRFPSRAGSSQKNELSNTEMQHTSKFTRGIFKRKESNKFSPRRKISFFRRKDRRLNVVEKSLKSKNIPLDAASSASSATEEKLFIEDVESKSFESLDEKQVDESDIHPESRSSDNIVLTEEPDIPSRKETKETLKQETSSMRKKLFEEMNEPHIENTLVQEKESFIYVEDLSETLKDELSHNSTEEQETVVLQDDQSMERTISPIHMDISLLKKHRNFGKEGETKKVITIMQIASIVITITFLLYTIVGLGLISNLVGFFYPAYMTLKTIESEKKIDNPQWITYWIIFSIFTMVESTLPFLTWFIPYYFHLKIGFFFWLYHPKVMGAKEIYNYTIRA